MSSFTRRQKWGTLLCAAFTGVSGVLYVAQDEPESIPFKDIPQKGDARLKRIVAEMRASKEGEKLYQYASQNGLIFQWSDESGDVGGYSQGKIYASPSYSDDETTYAMAHEIFHGWQDKSLKYKGIYKTPHLSWQINRVVEVSACAYTAHFLLTIKLRQRVS